MTGAAPSVGLVHGMLARTAGLVGVVHDRIHALITLAHAVCCDETLAAGRPAHPEAGQEEGPGATCWCSAPRPTPTTCSATGPWGQRALTVLRDAITGRPWMPALPAPT